MDKLRDRVEEHLTLPELLDGLDVDYGLLWDMSLEEFFSEYEEEITSYLEECT